MTAARVVPIPSGRQLIPPMLATAAAVLPAFLTGAVAVQLQADLRFSRGALGMSVAAFGAGGTLASTPLGWVSERVGAERAMRFGTLAIAGSLLWIALAVQSWPALAATLFGAGVANAIVQPAANLFLVRAVDPRRLGLAFGIKQSAIPAATLLGGLAVPGLALTVGWRWAFGLAAVIAVAAAVVIPSGHTPPPVRRHGREGDIPTHTLIVLAGGGGFAAAASGALGVFLVDSATDAGVANGTAGVLMAVGSVICLTTRLTSGARADRRGRGNLLVVSRMLALGALTYLVLAIGKPAAFYLAGPFAFAFAWGWPALFHLSIVRGNPGAPAAATGMIQTGSLFGALCGPLVFGGLAGVASYRVMWIAAATSMLAGALTISHGRRMILEAGRALRRNM